MCQRTRVQTPAEAENVSVTYGTYLGPGLSLAGERDCLQYIAPWCWHSRRVGEDFKKGVGQCGGVSDMAFLLNLVIGFTFRLISKVLDCCVRRPWFKPPAEAEKCLLQQHEDLTSAWWQKYAIIGEKFKKT